MHTPTNLNSTQIVHLLMSIPGIIAPHILQDVLLALPSGLRLPLRHIPDTKWIAIGGLPSSPPREREGASFRISELAIRVLAAAEVKDLAEEWAEGTDASNDETHSVFCVSPDHDVANTKEIVVGVVHVDGVVESNAC